MEEKIIYKYKLNIFGETLISLPKDSQLLSIGSQGEEIFIWVLHNIENELIEYTFHSFFTGKTIHLIKHEYAPTLKFIGTTTNSQGLVSHVFLEE